MTLIFTDQEKSVLSSPISVISVLFLQTVMMKQPYLVRLTDATWADILQQAGTILTKNGVIVCATDTGYLLGVDGLQPEAIRKIYQIKGRSFDKPIHLVVSDLTMAKTLAEFSPEAERLFQQFMPGPLTVVVKKKPVVPELLVSGLASIGLRMPDSPFLLRLVQETGIPITATSANRSGNATPYSIEQVLRELGEAVEYVDLLIDQGETQHTQPSTILDVTQTPPKILRQGPITAEMVERVLISTDSTETTQLRPGGLCAGEFTVPDDFDAPLPEHIIQAFERR